MRRSEETARLASAAARLESYDVVESRDEELEKFIKLHSSLDIMSAPMPGCPKDALRTLLREGDLKLRDAATSKVGERISFLNQFLVRCCTCIVILACGRIVYHSICIEYTCERKFTLRFMCATILHNREMRFEYLMNNCSFISVANSFY